MDIDLANRTLVVCSCGARAWTHQDPQGKFVCEDPTWQYRGEADSHRSGTSRAELEATPPIPFWHCGVDGHFQLLAVTESGGWWWGRELSLYPHHATPEMETLIEQILGEFVIEAKRASAL